MRFGDWHGNLIRTTGELHRLDRGRLTEFIQCPVLAAVNKDLRLPTGPLHKPSTHVLQVVPTLPLSLGHLGLEQHNWNFILAVVVVDILQQTPMPNVDVPRGGTGVGHRASPLSAELCLKGVFDVLGYGVVGQAAEGNAKNDLWDEVWVATVNLTFRKPRE